MLPFLEHVTRDFPPSSLPQNSPKLSLEMKFLTPILLALVLLLAGYLLYTRGFKPSQTQDLHGTALETPKTLPPLELDGSDGKKRQISDWKGKHVLVFFAYTHCPDICPLTLAALARSFESLKSPANLQILMVTVDPARDTPQRLHEYLSKFNSSFVGLTGTPAQIAQLSSAFYAGYSGSGIQIAHTDAMMLLDRDGRFVRVYNQGNLAKQELHRDLQRLLE
jgi:protein SCO1